MDRKLSLSYTDQQEVRKNPACTEPIGIFGMHKSSAPNKTSKW